MKQTIKVADKPTADKTKTIAESNGKKLDGIIKSLESGGMLADPDLGLEALKQSVDELKNYVGNGKKNVANAITAKGVTTATDAGFATLVDNINKIVTLIQGTQDATAGAGQVLNGYTAYAKGSEITGNIPSQGAQTITPKAYAQSIAAGRYLTGQQTIAGDANLIPDNIVAGKSIFGVAGNYKSSFPVNITCKEIDINNPYTSVSYSDNSIKLIFLMMAVWVSGSNPVPDTNITGPSGIKFIIPDGSLNIIESNCSYIRTNLRINRHSFSGSSGYFYTESRDDYDMKIEFVNNIPAINNHIVRAWLCYF